MQRPEGNKHMKTEPSVAEKPPVLDRYDRQVRLWGGHGQKKITAARAGVFGANGAAAETLKSLVLPGIGSFALVDEGVTRAEDVGTNFFLTAASVGKPKAAQMAANLAELNPEVTGEGIDLVPGAALDGYSAEGDADGKVSPCDRNWWKRLTIMIASNLDPVTCRRLGDVAEDLCIPFVVIRSVGWFGSVRLCSKIHTVCEARVEGRTEDLRITEPFPELLAFSLQSTDDFESMDDASHSKVPWVTILVRAVHDFRMAHDGRLPATSVEKSAFKDALKSQQRTSSEPNFTEASRFAYRCFSRLEVPPMAKEVLTEAERMDLPPCAFWALAKAAAHFVRDFGMLPLAGTLPDMNCDTETFLSLQRIYKRKSETDLTEFTRRLEIIIGTELLSGGLSTLGITEEDVVRFCRSAHGIAVLRLGGLRDEKNVENIVSQVDEDETLDGLYFAFQLLDDTAMGTKGVGKGTDPAIPKERAMPYMQAISASPVEIHSTSAVVGGVAAQETVKLLTGQFLTVSNTFLWDGARSQGRCIFV